MIERPILNNKISLIDFKEFYWLIEDLLQFCRAEGLNTTGAKIDISKRIEHYLKSGQKESREKDKSFKAKSTFDWRNSQLSIETVLTDNYKNTENVRAFFQQEIGKHFKFNVPFMNWMKNNAGSSLALAIEEWKRINAEMKYSRAPKEIEPQFEYNTYLRDFLADNPGLKRAIGIQLWNIKKTIRGDNKYRREDLTLIEEK